MAKSFPNTGATVIDSVADLPVASAALEGLMVFQKDSNELKICDGSNWRSVIDTDTPMGLVHLNTTTFSATSSINIDNIFSTTYDNYFFISSGVASANVHMQMKFRVGGTTTTDSTYRYGLVYASNSTSSPAQAAATAGSAFNFMEMNVTSYGASGYIMNPATAEPTRLISHSYNWNTSGSVWTMIYHAGTHSTSTAYDGVNLATSSGTVTGTIRFFGIKNS